MNKKDLPFLVLIGVAVIAWPFVDRLLIAPHFPAKPPPAAAAGTNDAALVTAPAAPKAAGAPQLVAAPGPDTPPVEAPSRLPAAALTNDEPAATGPETLVTLSNRVVEITFSSRGAAIVRAKMLEYNHSVHAKGERVVLDFAAAPALANEGVAGLGFRHEFETQPGADGRSVQFTRRTAAGLAYTRKVKLDESYGLSVEDTLQNTGAAPVELKNPGTRLGPMSNLPGESPQSGYVYLGIDTLSPGGEKVAYWSAKLAGYFKQEKESQSLERLPEQFSRTLVFAEKGVDWAAVKSKYFVQILKPSDRARDAVAHLRRKVFPEEARDPSFKPKVTVEEVSATMEYPSVTLQPGGEPVVRSLSYYLGPKKYSELSKLDYKRVEVMEFGMWGAIGKILLKTLNAIYSVVPNYGVAIMLLTIIVRILFWPLTHKSTNSMKRMAKIQPQVTELRAKYKDNPQKLQKATMELYKTNKVNPVSGCLPILVQIPVFIALFVVLRSAIELRFASFLWVHDLSEPENLLAGLLPFGLSLNILPLVMTATQVWQQHLTPTAGDPAQQKMMKWMPVIMLVFFYSFASGLVLYWTTNQCLMIVQLLIQKRRREHKPGAAKPGA